MRLRSVDIEWQPVDDEVVVLDVRSSKYLGANRTGAFLWQRLAHGTSRDELVAALASEFGLSEEQARRDVDRFVGTLSERGLLDAT